MKPRRIPFSADELAFVEALCDLPRLLLHTEFVHVFGRADVCLDHIKALCTRNKWATREPWTPEKDDMVRAHFPNNTTAVVAAMVGRTASAVSQRARTLGITKTAEYLASPAACRLRRDNSGGIAFRFIKGQAPVNKGVKMPKGWAPGRMRESQFVKGQDGWNWKPVGSTRVVGDGYEYTKVSDVRGVPTGTNWKMTHVLRWEAANGAVPEGHVLKCIDGNKRDTDPANWRLVSRSILPRLNGGRGRKLAYDDAPAELKPTVMAIALVEDAARQRKQVAA